MNVMLRLCSYFIVLGLAKGVLIPHIVFPKDGAIIYHDEIHIRGHLSGDLPDHSQVHICCWQLNSRFLTETISYCSKYDEKWNEVNVVEVPLPNRGRYELLLSVFRLNNPDDVSVDPIQDLVAESHSSFAFEIPPSCQSVLRDRKYTQPRYYDQMLSRAADDSVDGELDQFVNFHRTPLCYDEWIVGEHDTRDSTMRAMLSVTSASRGTFGVDFSMQQFGHGDTMLLDFVLDRHRHAPPRYVEVGTFGGVTALYLGMSSLLRGGVLDTFDVSDDRSSAVKLAWLPNMVFHLGDINGDVLPTQDRVSTTPQAVEVIKEAGIVLVDHVNRLDFVL